MIMNAKTYWIFLLTLALAILLNTGCPTSDQDPSNNGETRIKWKFYVPQPIYYSSPAIGYDGTIYFTTGIFKGTTSGSLYAMDPDGNLKWSYPLDNNGNSPAIGLEGNIYLQDRKHVIYAFTPNGSLKWRNRSLTKIFFSEIGQKTPAIGDNGIIYVGIMDKVFAINSYNGNVIWEFDAGTGGTGFGSSPIIEKNGTIYIAMNAIFVAVNPNGTHKWTFKTNSVDEMSFNSPAIGNQGTIYFATENNIGGYLYALNSDGTLKWRYTTEESRIIRASASIGADGTIYITTKYLPRLLALHPDGTKKWTYDVEIAHGFDDIYSSPTIGVDGTIYFGAETGFIYAVKSDGTLAWKQEIEVGINWSSAALQNNGVFYIGTIGSNDQGTFYAIQSDSMGLVNSDCPKFRGDNQNSGRFK